MWPVNGGEGTGHAMRARCPGCGTALAGIRRRDQSGGRGWPCARRCDGRSAAGKASASQWLRQPQEDRGPGDQRRGTGQSQTAAATQCSVVDDSSSVSCPCLFLVPLVVEGELKAADNVKPAAWWPLAGLVLRMGSLQYLTVVYLLVSAFDCLPAGLAFAVETSQ